MVVVGILWKYKTPLKDLNEDHFKGHGPRFIGFHTNLLKDNNFTKILDDQSASMIMSTFVYAGSGSLSDNYSPKSKKFKFWTNYAYATFEIASEKDYSNINLLDKNIASKLLRSKNFDWDENVELEKIFIIHKSDLDDAPKSYSRAQKFFWISKNK